MTIDSIHAGGKHSFRDFGLTIKSRHSNPPTKKSNRQTVAYMTGFYDFSALKGGEVAWEDRVVQYEFDIIGDTPQEVEEIKGAVLDWLCNIQDEDIYDDTMPYHHFHGSYEGVDPDDDDSGLQCTLTVSFVCHPFRIANSETRIRLSDGLNTIVNSGQSIIARVDCEESCVITMHGEMQTISGVDVELLIPIKRGENKLILSGADAILRYHAEVI